MVKLALLAAAFSLQIVFAQTAVISDLDETIKRTRVYNPARGLYNALFTRRVFAGMPALFKQMETYAPDFYVVSASPKLFKFKIKKLLNDWDLEPVKIYTRVFFEDKFRFKYNAIKEIIERGYENVILFGDDHELDPAVFDRIKQDFPEKVLAIYVHRIEGKTLPASSVPYYTSFDVALREYQAQRMPLAGADWIGNLLAGEERFFRVYPTYVECPKTLGQLLTPLVADPEYLIERINQRTLTYCRNF